MVWALLVRSMRHADIKKGEQIVRTHNISTLASELYDKLANNTNNEMFDANEEGLEDMYVDETAGVITIKYQDKTFEVIVRESF